LYSSTHHICTDNNTCTHSCHSVIQVNLLETENYTQLPTALRTHARTHVCKLAHHQISRSLIKLFSIVGWQYFEIFRIEIHPLLIFHFFAEYRSIKRKPLPYKKNCFKGVFPMGEGRDFPHPSRQALGPTMGIGSFPGVKRPWRGVDHTHHLVPRLKKE
jgi:hypothetical protein